MPGHDLTYRNDLLSLYSAHVKRGRVFREAGNRTNLVYLVEHPIDGGRIVTPGGKLFLASKFPLSKGNFSGPHTGLVEIDHVCPNTSGYLRTSRPGLDWEITGAVPDYYEVFVKLNKKTGIYTPVFRVPRRDPSTGRVLGDYSLKDLKKQVKELSG